MIILNKYKYKKKWRNKDIMPTPSTLNPNKEVLPFIAQVAEYENKHNAKSRSLEVIVSWEYYVHECNKEASISGIPLEGKYKIPIDAHESS